MGSSEQGSDVDFQTSIDTLCVNWDGFSDPQSGLGEILWSIGESPPPPPPPDVAM